MNRGRPDYVFVADDFTGASDTLATLARAGLEVRLFLEVPEPDAVTGLDAFGVATEARSLGRSELTALMSGIAARLDPHRPRFVHLKVCSTFDSSAETGNFALAMGRLHDRLAFDTRSIVGGQPSLGRYCVFGNLFARAGDGHIYRIDRHPVMRAHPVTPMAESDLVRHFRTIDGGEAMLCDRLALAEGKFQAADGQIVLFDALDAEDIIRIGRRLTGGGRVLCAGASSVAEAFVGGSPPGRPAAPLAVGGPLLAFAGSRSEVSARQVRSAQMFHKIEVGADELSDHRFPCLVEMAAASLRRGQSTMLVLTDSTKSETPPHHVAWQSARLVEAIAKDVTIGGLLIAGGDTSSAIVRLLGPFNLSFIGDIDPGVPLCSAVFADGVRLPMVLKGGQVGRPELFDHIAENVLRQGQR